LVSIVNSSPTKILVLVFALVLTSPHYGVAAQPASNVVLITIDTLRADHLGCYGDASIQTPNIDRLARESARFTHAYTPVPVTLPAHAALFTGAFPLATGMHDFTGNKLPSGAATLAQELRNQGYATAAFIGSAVLDSRFGLNRGFDIYFDHFDFRKEEEVHLDAIERRADQVVDEALKWLSRNPNRPFFLWVHLYDPHAPYNPPEPFASRYLSQPYDGEIAFADAQVGRLFAFLRRQGVFDPSLLVLASDHGESLGEHGEQTHGFFIYDSTLHIPLIIKVPGTPPRVVRDEVSLVDVMPTLLQAVKIPVPASVQGRSLLGLILGRPAANTSNLYAESYLPLLHFGWNPLRSVRWQGWKFIETARPELYNTRTDNKEVRNLFSTQQARAQELRDRLNRLVRLFAPQSGELPARKEPIDLALAEALRSLGYAAFSAGNIIDAQGKPLADPKDRIQVYELVSAAMADTQQGHHRESLRKLQDAEKADKNSLAIGSLIAREYYHLSDFPRAAGYFQSSLRVNPKDAMASYYLGLCRLEMGDLAAAETSFRRTLELDPTIFSAAYNLGVVYSRQQRTEDAVQAFQRAVAILPDYAEAHEALGELFLYLHRSDDAVRELERAVAIAPKMAKAHYHLGRAYAAQGLQEKAQRELDRAKAP
jgi:arylsulfatase A-like enzyme/Flp pilus assembly protein TadD